MQRFHQALEVLHFLHLTLRAALLEAWTIHHAWQGEPDTV